MWLLCDGKSSGASWVFAKMIRISKPFIKIQCNVVLITSLPSKLLFTYRVPWEHKFVSYINYITRITVYLLSFHGQGIESTENQWSVPLILTVLNKQHHNKFSKYCVKLFFSYALFLNNSPDVKKNQTSMIQIEMTITGLKVQSQLCIFNTSQPTAMHPCIS